MNRDQLWALKRDIQRHLIAKKADDPPRGNALHTFGDPDPVNFDEISLLRRTLDLLEDL